MLFRFPVWVILKGMDDNLFLLIENLSRMKWIVFASILEVLSDFFLLLLFHCDRCFGRILYLVCYCSHGGTEVFTGKMFV